MKICLRKIEKIKELMEIQLVGRGTYVNDVTITKSCVIIKNEIPPTLHKC